MPSDCAYFGPANWLTTDLGASSQNRAGGATGDAAKANQRDDPGYAIFGV